METNSQTTGQSKTNKFKNKRWEENHAAITDAYLNLIGKYKRRPTLQEVQAELKRPPSVEDPDKIVCTAGIDTICKHIQEITFEPSANPLRLLTDQVLVNVFTLSKKSAASQKLWFQIVEGWKESTEISGPDGAPLIPENYDYSRLTESELNTLLVLLEKAKTAPDATGPTED